MTRRAANLAVGAVVLLVPVLFVAFCVLRRIQLSLPDPYNNPYTDWSTLCLLGVLVFWIVGLIMMSIFRNDLARVTRVSATVVLGLATLFAAFFIIGLFRFVFG